MRIIVSYGTIGNRTFIHNTPPTFTDTYHRSHGFALTLVLLSASSPALSPAAIGRARFTASDWQEGMLDLVQDQVPASVAGSAPCAWPRGI